MTNKQLLVHYNVLLKERNELQSELDKPITEHPDVQRLIGQVVGLQAEKDRYQKLHEAELGICEQHCDVVTDLKTALTEILKMRPQLEAVCLPKVIDIATQALKGDTDG